MNAKYLKQWCLFLVLSLLSALSYGRQTERIAIDSVPVAGLPGEARRTLAQVRRGPPYDTQRMALPSAITKDCCPGNHAVIIASSLSRRPAAAIVVRNA